MVFEVVAHDLAGRIGKFHTPGGTIETPLLFPVVNPTNLTITPRELASEFGCTALITNAYFLWQRCRSDVLEKGIHRFLDFDGVIMTDSGAYQILMYGDVNISPTEVLQFQRQIGSDLGVILDVPTGGDLIRSKAEATVEKTIARARDAVKYWNTTSYKEIEGGRQEPLWVGPVQGGLYSDLVKASAKAMTALGFQAFALGSPTPLLERYLYPELVQLIVTAKQNLPINSPVHLFGAGHPMILPLAVALGCDLFDSAAYALFARQDRYILPYGTIRLDMLKESECLCPICSKYSPKELRQQEKDERFNLLARHNLYVTFAELAKTKQAIHEGRLWELIQRKATNHPQMLEATRLLGGLQDYLEQGTPLTKARGILYTGINDFNRPEVYRHQKLIESWTPIKTPFTLILLEPENGGIGFYAWGHKRVIERLKKLPKPIQDTIAVGMLSIPFGFVPWELSTIYPLSQHNTLRKPNSIEWKNAVSHLTKIISKHRSSIQEIILLGIWNANMSLPRLIQEIAENMEIPFCFIKSQSKFDSFRSEHLKRLIEHLDPKNNQL